MRRRSTTVLAGLIALFAPSVAGAIDMTGRWQMDFGTGPERVDVVQTGSSVAFTISGFPIVATLNGKCTAVFRGWRRSSPPSCFWWITA